jgi:nitroimidazol reductase NimA-like FMN-containing flavoprotein (pyridoxamine 5'-phosphate oxidase superfamily)
MKIQFIGLKNIIMQGTLSKEQSEDVLRAQLVGRIGCYAFGKVYVVPVAYVFEKNYIYMHSREGLKIKMMRKNPKVCFEVESKENMVNWRTVIIQGRYEELKTLSEQNKAMKILSDRFLPFQVSEAVKPTQINDPPLKIQKEHKPKIYRISVDEISGKYEKSD